MCTLDAWRDPVFPAIRKRFRGILEEIFHLHFLQDPQIGHLQMGQRLLILKYRELLAAAAPLPSLEDVEYKVFSQHEEDGIIVYLLTLAGSPNRRFLEIGIGDGTECNSANLAKCLGWQGWLVEGNPAFAEAARRHYAGNKHTFMRDIRVITAKVTPENVNDVIVTNGMANRVDFLSIDVDGMDWWLWQRMEGIAPTVVCVEYNASLGPHRAVTVPYRADFDRHAAHPSGFYHGASLRAFVGLANRKGYTFVGCASSGVNAFFVRSDALPSGFPPVTVESAFRTHSNRDRRVPFPEQWKMISALPFVDVG